MSTLDRLTDDHLESIVEAIGALTDVVQKAGLKISIEHRAVLLGFVRLAYPRESPSLGEAIHVAHPKSAELVTKFLELVASGSPWSRNSLLSLGAAYVGVTRDEAEGTLRMLEDTGQVYSYIEDDGAWVSIARKSPEPAVCKFGPGGDFVREWPGRQDEPMRDDPATPEATP